MYLAFDNAKASIKLLEKRYQKNYFTRTKSLDSKLVLLNID